MDGVCIDARIIGTEKHLFCHDGEYTWLSVPPLDVWHLSGELKSRGLCLDTLFKLNGIVIDVSPPKRFVSAMETLVSGSNVIPWRSVMPSSAYMAFVKNLENEVAVAMAELSKDYYVSTWGPGNEVIGRLERARIDEDAWASLVSRNIGNVNVVKTFEPDALGFAGHVVYDRFGTRTGRLTVTSGPNILTLKREHRNIITSTFLGGKIAYVDFAALEARVLLYEAGGRCEEPDLYAMIVRDVFDGKASRKAVKGAVISELYGSSKESLGESLKMSGKELTRVVSGVKTLFRTKDLLKRTKQQFVEKGYITNRYGRRVTIDEPLNHIFVNSYAQSTGADVVMLGFNQVLKDLTGVPGIRPLFLLHDALVLDCSPAALERLATVCWVKVPGYVQKFALAMNT